MRWWAGLTACPQMRCWAIKRVSTLMDRAIQAPAVVRRVRRLPGAPAAIRRQISRTIRDNSRLKRADWRSRRSRASGRANPDLPAIVAGKVGLTARPAPADNHQRWSLLRGRRAQPLMVAQ